MQIPRPGADDRELFRALVPDHPTVAVKPMFGNLGAFVNGNMFMGLFGDRIGVKLSPDDAALLLAEPGAGPFGPEGRPMGGYVSLPADWLPSSEEASAWTARSLDYVASLPPKKPKTKK